MNNEWSVNYMTNEFHKRKLEELTLQEIENIIEERDKARADLDYIAMMTDVDIPAKEDL